MLSCFGHLARAKYTTSGEMAERADYKMWQEAEREQGLCSPFPE